MPRKPKKRLQSPPALWQPLRPARYSAAELARVRATYGEDAARQVARAEVYQNDRYEVAVYRDLPAAGEGPALIHLSIKRRDRRPVHDWRDLQRIKNEVLSPEHEAVELYPAESRLVDAANQYHLWALDDPAFRFPFGFVDRLVSEMPPRGGAQRPFA